MDARSDRSSTHHEGYRLSSSLPQQSWSHPSASSYPSPAAATPVSPPARPPHHPPAVDESILARRTTAFRQLNGNPKPLSRKHRQNKSIGSRSTLASQPVLVRSYSGETDDRPRSSSTMPSGPFSFVSGSRAQQSPPELPSVQDFSIEGILRAIEPDIQSTLDSIAEIYGRSKLSLANEYGSHIAPLGEIRAPPGGLLTVEEASSSNERLVDDNVVIVDDDTSFLDGRDNYPPSTYGFLESLRHTVHAVGNQANIPPSVGDGASMQAQPDTPRSTAVTNPALDIEAVPRSLLVTHEFTSRPKAGSRALLRNNVESTVDGQLQGILTPAVVSEVHLDARADQPTWLLTPPDTTEVPSHEETEYDGPGTVQGASTQNLPIDKQSLLADLQGLLSWLKGYAQRGTTKGRCEPPHSAETRLRAMLERQNPHPAHISDQGIATHTG